MAKRLLATLCALCWLLALTAIADAATISGTNDKNWVFIAKDTKYGKFYAPGSIQKMSESGGVATRFSALIKTTYTVEGAQETIDNYAIGDTIPDAKQLAYSLALVEVCPQVRTIEYAKEDFYTKDGTPLWSKVYEPRTVKEINSQSYDEDYYIALVDAVFHYGERKRKEAPDRWINLYSVVGADKGTTAALADTTTMRLVAGKLIYWEWVEVHDPDGTITQAKFMKKALNADAGTEQVIECQLWTADKGWVDARNQYDGQYHAVPSEAAHGLARLRAYVKGYQYWLNRYSTTATPKAAKSTTAAPTSAKPTTAAPTAAKPQPRS